MKIKKLLFISILFVVYGCENTSLIKAEEIEDVSYVFSTSEDYQSIYRKILKQAKTCSRNSLTSRMEVRGELFSDIKSADIEMSQIGIVHKMMHMQVSVEADANTKGTKITVHNSFYRWNAFALAVRDWVLSNSSECPPLK